VLHEAGHPLFLYRPFGAWQPGVLAFFFDELSGMTKEPICSV
jgi:hypothetical protein